MPSLLAMMMLLMVPKYSFFYIYCAFLVLALGSFQRGVFRFGGVRRNTNEKAIKNKEIDQFSIVSIEKYLPVVNQYSYSKALNHGNNEINTLASSGKITKDDDLHHVDFMKNKKDGTDNIDRLSVEKNPSSSSGNSSSRVQKRILMNSKSNLTDCNMCRKESKR